MKKAEVTIRSIDELPALVSPKDMEHLGFSRPVVYRLFQSSGFPSVRIGRRRVVRKEKLIEWLDAGAEMDASVGGDQS